MINLLQHPLYQEDIQYIAQLALPWEKLQKAQLLITGASGLLGSFLIDVIMWKNMNEGLNCSIYALGRNINKLHQRFCSYKNSPVLQCIEGDVINPLTQILPHKLDYVLHLASNTHPVLYATDPVGTILTNILGTQHLLEFLRISSPKSRFLLASSNEIYGENRGDVELFDEKYCGYIDSNTLRAGYPESKRCAESLCQAYIKQYEMDIVIARLTRSYGPTLQVTDTKALSQFIHCALSKKDIVLKSNGQQYYSYTYMADAVSGLLTVLLNGATGEAYNIADKSSDIHLRDLAQLVAHEVGRKVIFQVSDAVERAGYSKVTKARLCSLKLQALGWKPHYSIAQGIKRTLAILQHNS